MAFVILASLALLGVIAFVVNEIRTAPEVDDSYEVRLWNFYRDKEARGRRTSRQAEPPRENDAA